MDSLEKSSLFFFERKKVKKIECRLLHFFGALRINTNNWDTENNYSKEPVA